MSNVRQMSPHDTADDDALNRLPPGDPAAERALITRCINRPDEYTVAAEIIGSDDFTHPAYRILWDAIGQQLADKKPVDPVALRATVEALGQLRMFSNGALIWEIARELGPGDAEYYAELIQAKTRLRRIDDLAVRLRSGVLNGGAVDDLEEQITGYVQQRGTAAAGSSRFVPGGAFILDRPDTVPAVWGEGDQILWAEGEALIIAGPPGVGKTTVGQQVLLAAIGVRAHALGMAVRPAKRVLYLASDRPQQAARSMARMVTDEHRDILNQHLVFWPGPPPKDFIKDPGILVRLCKQADADMVCLDSLKDMAGELSSEEGGQAINGAIQRTLVEGVEVLALHHHRKQGGGKDSGREPTSLDELYGSAWITAGAGSVVSLWGSAGDPIVAFKHLKQPASECGPWRLKHDHPRGVTEIWHEVDVLDILAHAQGPLTPQQLACQIYSPDKGKPTASEVEKARRRLDQLVEKGLAHKISNGGGRGKESGYVASFSTTGEIAS
ncbi:AAA family ATPase [Streptomyces sp. NBC_01373]|uniref:AAA family ATPase n=1 Tax=Streptomyces sp. NBC_01373 TaxID=2903843 RepID=UPI00224CA42A|nr:AAA family ATPase [Streptomyces sp. NBC_01373]MCX4703909.1 AAA family ATPase [Streptomyces sp. NBC_01373]